MFSQTQRRSGSAECSARRDAIKNKVPAVELVDEVDVVLVGLRYVWRYTVADVDDELMVLPVALDDDVEVDDVDDELMV